MAIAHTISAACELNEAVQVTRLGRAQFTGEEAALQIRVAVTRGGTPCPLEGLAVTGYQLRADGTTLVISGSAEGHEALLTLPAEACAVPGAFQLLIRLADGAAARVLFWGEGTVTRGETDTLLSAGEAVPDLNTLLARLAALEAATDAAVSATAALRQERDSLEDLMQAYAPSFATEEGQEVTFLPAEGTRLWPILRFRTPQTGAGQIGPENPRPFAPVTGVTLSLSAGGETRTAQATIQDSGTVGAGVVDWRAGTLRVTHGLITLDGNAGIRRSGAWASSWTFAINVPDMIQASGAEVTSDWLPRATSAEMQAELRPGIRTSYISGNSASSLIFGLGQAHPFDVEEMKAYLAEHPLTVLYPLQEERSIPLALPVIRAGAGAHTARVSQGTLQMRGTAVCRGCAEAQGEA